MRVVAIKPRKFSLTSVLVLKLFFFTKTQIVIFFHLHYQGKLTSVNEAFEVGSMPYLVLIRI